MARKPEETVSESYKVTAISVHSAETHGGILLKIEPTAEGGEEYLDVDDAKLYVPDGSKVNIFKLIKWFRTSKDVSVIVTRLPKKYMKVKEARFIVPPE